MPPLSHMKFYGTKNFTFYIIWTLISYELNTKFKRIIIKQNKQKKAIQLNIDTVVHLFKQNFY